MDKRESGDVDADLGGERLHLALGADERRLDQVFVGSFHGTSQPNVRHGPADSRGDRGQGLAAIEKFVKDMEVSRMANERVNGYAFSERGKVTHRSCLPG